MRMEMLLLALAQAPAAQEWIETVVPRMASAEAQLAHARRIKHEMRGHEGAELSAWRCRTVEAYRAVRLFHPEARAACVEAAFRAGEILRAAENEAAALAEFGWAARQRDAGQFRTRAELEIGHLHRRALRFREALEAYLDVGGDPAAGAARRDDAWLWAGTCWKRLGNLEEARSAWRRVAEHGTDPLARIAAYDELALTYVEESELEGAAGVLDQCLRALSASALEETEQGERVENALQRMRVVEELSRALARKKDACVERGSERKS
jgi:tetratricopeptide (TPR) repeat protein